jgi:hypothetical protein
VNEYKLTGEESISNGCQVLSDQGSKGAWRRSIGNRLLPGTVVIQLASCPAAAVGPKRMVVESSLAATVRLRLFRLGYGVSVCSRERVRVSWMSTAPI